MVNLLVVYEVYLLAALLLGIAQIRNHLRLVRFALSVPGRWPRIFRLARDNIHVLLTWPVLLVGGVMLGTWAASILLRNLLFPAASVEPPALAANLAALGVVVVAGLVMLAFDLRATFRAASFRPPRLGWLLDLTEAGLAAEAGRGPFSFLVGWQIRGRLGRQSPFVQRWLWWRTLEIANRLVVGVALWWTWLARA